MKEKFAKRTDPGLIRIWYRVIVRGERHEQVRIEKGVSRINRVKLQASIEEPVAAELALICEWSTNDRNYVVNELLRFALSQDSEFQAYKESADSSSDGKPQAPMGSARSRTATPAKAQSDIKEPVSDTRRKGTKWLIV